MNFRSKIVDAKLEALRNSERFESVEQILEAVSSTIVSPAISINCDCTTESKPDRDKSPPKPPAASP